MAANSSDTMNSANYLAYIYQAAELPFDFAAHYFHLVNPEFVVLEGKLLIPAIGAVDRFAAMRDKGRSPAEAQYWANLFFTSDFMGADTRSKALSLAVSVSICWRSAIDRSNFEIAQPVRVCENLAEDEVYIVLSDWDQA